MTHVPASSRGATFAGGTITGATTFTAPVTIDLSADVADRTALDVIEPATFGFTVRPFRFRQTDFAYLQMETTGVVSTAGNSLGTAGGSIATQGGQLEVSTALGSNRQVLGADAIGFFGNGTVTQPAAPVTLADVIAALKSLGLVAT